MNYWPLIVGTHPDNHVLHTFLSYNFSFPSLSTVTSLIPPTNDSPVLMDFTFGISKLHMTLVAPKLSPSRSKLMCIVFIPVL